MSAVLVAYATKHGSTREVAECIAATLQGGGVGVDVLPAGQIRDPIAGRDLVVLGAPIYSGRWHRDAHQFLERHRGELLNTPAYRS
jgi:menaquinone-dependent protoporphyrinogen oxidase